MTMLADSGRIPLRVAVKTDILLLIIVKDETLAGESGYGWAWHESTSPADEDRMGNVR